MGVGAAAIRPSEQRQEKLRKLPVQKHIFPLNTVREKKTPTVFSNRKLSQLCTALKLLHLLEWSKFGKTVASSSSPPPPRVSSRSQTGGLPPPLPPPSSSVFYTSAAASEAMPSIPIGRLAHTLLVVEAVE